MNFSEFKHTINIIDDCEELCEPYTFERFLTTLQNIKLKLDTIETRVDEATDKINNYIQCD